MMLLGIIFVPTLGAFLLPLVGAISPKLRNWLGLSFILVSLVLSLMLIPSAMAGQTITVDHPLPQGLRFVLRADMLAVFMACVSSFISAVILFYSTSYISHYDHQNEYYLMVVLFLGAMMGLVFAGNLILLYLFWEITAIASWRLIGFFRQKQHVVRADKAFLVTVFGALAMLLGFIVVFTQTGSFDLLTIKEKLGGAPLGGLAVVLIMMGILSKSATLPFHTWLPDAGVAPSPVTALLHAAVLVKIGVYVYARLFVATFTVSEYWHTTILAVAAASALVSAGAALIDKDIKRIIAYSTVSQIAFIFLGLAACSPTDAGFQISIAGALLYILMHGLAKGGLFLCAGIIEQKTHTKDISQMGGLIRTMPVTAVSFLFCAFSVMGIPPFGGFFSKYMVISGAVQTGLAGAGGGQLWLAMVFLVGAFLTILYLLRLFNMVFMGETRFPEAREGSAVMVASVALLAALSLAGGLLIRFPSQFAQAAVHQMLGLVK